MNKRILIVIWISVPLIMIFGGLTITLSLDKSWWWFFTPLLATLVIGLIISIIYFIKTKRTIKEEETKTLKQNMTEEQHFNFVKSFIKNRLEDYIINAVTKIQQEGSQEQQTPIAVTKGELYWTEGRRITFGQNLNDPSRIAFGFDMSKEEEKYMIKRLPEMTEPPEEEEKQETSVNLETGERKTIIIKKKQTPKQKKEEEEKKEEEKLESM